MSFLASLESIVVVITCFVLMFFAIFFLYIFIVEYFFKRKEAQAEGPASPLEEDSEEFYLFPETEFIESLSSLVIDLSLVSREIKKLNRSEFDIVISNLNTACDCIMNSSKTIFELTYMVVEKEDEL